jgi:Caspase domain
MGVPQEETTMSRFIIPIFVYLCVLSTSAGAETTVYKWTDYRKPFGTRIVGINDSKPAIVEVDLPESVVENKEVALIVSASLASGTYGMRVLLSVNGRRLPSLMPGPRLRVVLGQEIIKPGINKLALLADSKYSMIDIYDLRIELGDTVAKTNPPPASKSIDIKKKVEPEPIKISQPATIVEPVVPKQEETSHAGKKEITPEKDTLAPVGRSDIGQRWAVIIGVSEYQDSRIPGLRYATRDAQAVYDWLVSPNGGRFAPSRVNLLLDRKATNENIKGALFAWLKQAIEEDLVVIYFAGHGSPESPDALQNLYLLPHNTKYNSIAASGFPMWDIETALKRFIKAKRVVIIADACHSAGVGQAFDMATRTGRGIQINPINSGFQNLTDLGKGICLISASRDKELSREGSEWGGGHGVFSYYLLEGLKGAADFDNSGSVTIGELTVYVSQQVRRATLNAQNPIVSGSFDPSLTISK